MTPAYVVIGAQRAGTTALYRYLITHPSVGAAAEKEVHYFDLNSDRPFSWYRSFFPLGVRGRTGRRNGRPYITGEATPYYLFHPLVPERMAAALPGAKLIVLLRNPVDRAYSHYQLERWLGVETASFEEALEREPDRLDGEVGKMLRDPSYTSFAHQHFSYRSRGLYSEQLDRWLLHYPRDQVLVVESERLFGDAAGTVARVLSFLGLPPHPVTRFSRENARQYPRMEGSTRERLARSFAEPNERLFELLGERLGWG